jgi:hypothetical protein
MSQHDYIISNDTGANVRSDLNNALGAIATINSGATEPSTTYAYQLWMDTSSNVLKIRNSANSAWYTLPISPIANNTVDINGGTIDGVTIGGSSAGAITGTNLTATTSATLQHSSSTKLATTSTGIDVTGTVTADGLTVDGDTVTANAQNAVTMEFNSATGIISADRTGGNYADLSLRTTAGSTPLERLRISYDGDISFYEDTGTTPKFFWDASAERLGIGTTSVDSGVHVESSSGANAQIKIQTGDTTSYSQLIFGDSADSNVGGVQYNHSDDSLQFHVGNIGEKVRIDSSGNLLVGALAPVSASVGGFQVNSSGQVNTSIPTTSPVIHHRFYNLNGVVGTITTSGSATAYNTSSDYRLKEDWQPMSGSIDRLKALNPVNFAWKADGSRVDGFLAHEAAEVVPEAVSGEKDAVEAIGNVTDAEGTVVQENVTEPAELAEGQTWTKTEDRPVYQGIDQAKLVPLLTAALQEAVSKIEALETRIAALEA